MLSSLAQVLPDAARRYGTKRALVFGAREYSYLDLDRSSARLAHALCELGVRQGDRITLYCGNSPEWVVSYYAIHKLGAIANPVSVMLTPVEVEFAVNDCGACAIITDAARATGLQGLPDRSGVRHIIAFGSAKGSATLSFEALLERDDAPFQRTAAAQDSLSTICYTSGTTGHPKGAMLSHHSVLFNAEMTALMHVRTPQDTVVTCLPCSHVYGNVVMNSAFLHGMTLVLHSTFDGPALLESIECHRATMFEGVPTMYMYLLNDRALARADVSSLTRCTVGGQTMPVAKMQEVEARFGCPLIELWGMTEMAGLGSTHPLYGQSQHGSVGIPLPGTQLRIAALDDASRSLQPGEVGELMARGPHIMMGYFGNDAATRETIETDGWLHTGDLASMDAAGYCYIVDRKKDMILTGGYNVYPAELERVIASHPAVAMVAVGGIPDPIKGELAKAYVVLRGGTKSSPEEILVHCRAHLAAYKVPRAVQFVADLPKTSTGKVMRRELIKLNEPA